MKKKIIDEKSKITYLQYIMHIFLSAVNNYYLLITLDNARNPTSVN